MSFKLRLFIPFAVAITGLSLLAFGMAQQLNRLSAYDPQVQIAEDISSALDNGILPSAIIGKGKIDMGKSLAPFVILYDSNGKPTSTSAVLNGIVPVPPSGVFSFTNQHGQDRLTWQPAGNARVAAIVMKYKNGYVLAGRSMAEVESRIDKILHMMIFGWAIIMIATFAAIYIFIPETNPHKK